MMNMA